MFKVYIPSGNFHIERQLPLSCNNRWGNCEFVFDPNESYDYFVTIDSLDTITKCNVDKSHRLLFLGEPPYVRRYNVKFLEQYGHVFTCQKANGKNVNTTRLYPLLPWMLGISLQENSHSVASGVSYLSYDDFTNLQSYDRLNRACLITSNKTFTKGHRDRVKFANYVLDNYSDIIDVFGNGYLSIPDKLEVLRKYKYAIVIENCRYPDYWTEKIGDCYLAGCYPIYHGCTNIKDYFPRGSYSEINIRNINEAIFNIKEIIKANKFEGSIQYLNEAKNFVLNKYNIFPQIESIILQIEKNSTPKSVESIPVNLLPMRLTTGDRIIQFLTRRFNGII